MCVQSNKIVFVWLFDSFVVIDLNSLSTKHKLTERDILPAFYSQEAFGVK